MKNFFFSFLTIIALSAITQIFMPWWCIAIAAFIAGYLFKQSTFASFLSAFIAVFVLWVAYAFMLSAANENILASKVAMLLPLNGSVKMLLLVTGLVGGLVSGFGALSGNFAAKVIEK